MNQPARKAEIYSREMIKPSSQTPNHKKTHKLSFFDQLTPPIYIPLLFFYELKPVGPNNTIILKTSLSLALTKYYPLAGRITDSLTVDCNDKGVVFLQARMNSKLSEILELPTDEALKPLFPEDLCYKDTNLSSPLTVQVTEFDCGGIALGICVSHKILDMSSICSFVNYWAALASNRIKIMDTPLEFISATTYPPVELQVSMAIYPPPVKCINKRLVFSGQNISKLQSMVNTKVSNPTRLEVVLALVYGSAISAARSCPVRISKPTVLSQAVNMRGRLTEPAPSITSVGNFSSTFAMTTPLQFDSDRILPLVEAIRETKTEYFGSCTAEFADGEEFCKFVVETTKEFRGASSSGDEGVDVYISSSWCGFALYDSDFGFGKPVWTTTAGSGMKDVIILMDTRSGDGIEALVCLEEKEMAVFEQDPRVLDFAQIDPNPMF